MLNHMVHYSAGRGGLQGERSHGLKLWLSRSDSCLQVCALQRGLPSGAMVRV
jgi:hypothetical protein